MLRVTRAPRRRHSISAAATLAVVAGFVLPAGGSSQLLPEAAPDSAVIASPAMELAASSGPPIGIVLGLGWGMRRDDCLSCAEPENTASFAFHLSLTRPLIGGVGVGLDISAWQRGHPAPAGAVRPDAGGDGGDGGGSGEELESLTNRLANASVVFSYQASPLYLRGGVGVALAWSDVIEGEVDAPLIRTASGKGVGFTAGGGLLLPISGNIGLAFYANWNYGRYDLSSPTRVVARDATHDYLELGVGIAFR